MKKKSLLTSTPIRAVHRSVINTISKWGKSMLISNQLIMKARSLLALVVLVSFHGTALADESEIAFDIDAQELGAALNEFALQSNKEILFVEAETVGKSATEVIGTYEPIAALELLLAESGLEYWVNALDTVLVGVAGKQRGASDSGNLSPTPVSMAQSQTSQAQMSSQSSEGGTSIVTGKVTDARTGANLRGAKVTVEETGQWTSTGDLGQFRFASVPNGSVTLTVSFLGYSGQSAVIGVRGGSVSKNFALRGGSELEEIVVFGTRSARALALNQERTAQNSVVVLSDDFIGQFEGNTVSEALRRAPGVTFIQDPQTGDGTNVVIRGFEPDFNTVTLNGLRLPEGSGEGRSPDLSNILTDSISSIRINRTLLPNQDGTGTGGLVEIETKGPLDRPQKFFQLSLEGATRDGDFEDEFLASGTVSGKFGDDDQFGLSASFQYRDQDKKSLSYSTFYIPGQYLPLDDTGNPILFPFQLPIFDQFPFEPGVDQLLTFRISAGDTLVEAETSAGTLSAQWAPSVNHEFRLDYTFSDRDSSSSSANTSLVALPAFVLVPIPEAGNQERSALVWRNAVIDGESDGPFLSLTRDFRGEETNTQSHLVSFEATSQFDRWGLDFRAGYSTGDRELETYSIQTGSLTAQFPDYRDLLTEGGLSRTIGNFYQTPFGPPLNSGLPDVFLNEQAFGIFNDAAGTGINSTSFGARPGENTRVTTALDVSYEFGYDWLTRASSGFFFESSEFTSDLFSPRSINLAGFTLGEIGINTFGDAIGEEVGLSYGINTLAPEVVQSIRSRLPQIANQLGIPFESFGPIEDAETQTVEDNLAGYFQLEGEIDRLGYVVGLRVENVEVEAENILIPTITDADGASIQEAIDRLSRRESLEGSQTNLLPRLALNYRFTEKLQMRLGYGKVVARPRVSELSDTIGYTLNLAEIYGPNGDQPWLRANLPNPDLEPAETNYFDLSLEYFFDEIGVLRISSFYKETDNLLETISLREETGIGSVPLPNDPVFEDLPDNIFVEVTQARNAESDASVWGVELVGERRFPSLPGFWSGLGVYGNYSYTDSDRVFTVNNFVNGERVEVGVRRGFTGDPEHSGTVALTYEKSGINGSLSYTYQGRAYSGFSGYGLERFIEEDESLDLRVQYTLPTDNGNYRLFLEGTDLLKNSDDTDVRLGEGGIGRTPEIITGASYLGGRSLSIGVVATF